MELVCLCCLAETNRTFKITTRCEFQAEECYDNIQTNEAIQLGDIYSQLTQLPLPKQGAAWTNNQQICEEVCSRCVAVLKEFYLFRMKALKAHEELQTKANIAKIINNLEQSSVGSVRAEQIDEDFANTGVEFSDEKTECSPNEATAGPFSCKICKKLFKKRKLLARHEEIHSCDRKYHCRYCEKDFVAKVSCYNHELKKHRKQFKPDAEQPSVGCKIYPEKNKPTDSKKQQQQKQHFQCDLCTKSFTRKSSLNDHKLVLHAGMRLHSCHICNRAFGKEGSLKTHLALHFGKKYRCKLCSKTFAKASFLRNHLEEHEIPETRRKYTCSVCSKTFTAISHLNDHELVHSDKRPHTCNLCSKSFRQKQQLKVHTYIHYGKPFPCGDCDATYTSRSRLQNHVQKHHQQPRESCGANKSLDIAADTSNVFQPDFGDKAVNEDLLNEICYQIDSNPIILENIEAGGVNLICNEQTAFFN